MNNSILSVIPYLKGMNNKALAYLKENAVSKNAFKGQHLFFTNDQCTKLYIIKEGLIKIYLIGEDGKEIIIHYSGKGKFLGDTILFNDEPYGANACAVVNTELITIDSKVMENVIRLYPEIGIKMLADFGYRLKRMMRLIGEMALSDVKKRLVRLILELAKESGIESEGNIVLSSVPRQDEMASMIGTKREVLCRELHKLEKERLLTVNRGRIVIQNIDRLHKKILEDDKSFFPTFDNGITHLKHS